MVDGFDEEMEFVVVALLCERGKRGWIFDGCGCFMVECGELDMSM